MAHEWWHGLDDFLGEKMGAKGLLSERPRTYPPMQKLIDTIKYKPMPPEQAAEQAARQNAFYRSNAEYRLGAAVLSSLQRAGNEKALEDYAALKSAFLSGEPGMVDKISDFKKAVAGSVIPKSERDTLYSYEHLLSSMAGQTGPPAARMETHYYRNSKKMGQECENDGGYWESNTEMTARTFACYVMDKLRPERSDYLCGHAECAVTLLALKRGIDRDLIVTSQREALGTLRCVIANLEYRFYKAYGMEIEDKRTVYGECAYRLAPREDEPSV